MVNEFQNKAQDIESEESSEDVEYHDSSHEFSNRNATTKVSAYLKILIWQSSMTLVLVGLTTSMVK